MSSGRFSGSNAAAATVAATLTISAPGAGSQLRARNFTFTISSGATASGVVLAVIRSGATGAGDIIWSSYLSCPVNDTATVTVNAADIRAAAGTAMTLEFTAGGGATSQQSVAVNGDVVGSGWPPWSP